MDNILGSTSIKIICTALTALLSWRLWRFTIRPQLHPDEPKEYPHWVPFLGHVAGFFADFNGAIDKGRKHFQPAQEPFAMTVAGQTIYVATSAEDINGVWRNSKAMSMDPIAMDMYVMGDISEKSRKAMFELHPDARYNAGNTRPLTPTDMINEIHRRKLNGPRLDNLMGERNLPGILRRIKTLEYDHPAVTSRSLESITVSLLQLCIDIFIIQVTDTFFEPELRQVGPGLVPSIFAKDMHAAKATMASAFTNYFKLPRSERSEATFFVSAMEDTLREVGLTEDEMGRFTLLQYWAIVGNVYKLAFWLVAHLTRDPLLLKQIRQEVAPAVKGDSIDETYLLKECPKLESLFNEMLRLTVSSSLARVVTETSVAGGKTLKPGNKIMLPIQPLHLDPQVWGPDPGTFQPDRFIKDTKLSKSLSYRP